MVWSTFWRSRKFLTNLPRLSCGFDMSIMLACNKNNLFSLWYSIVNHHVLWARGISFVGQECRHWNELNIYMLSVLVTIHQEPIIPNRLFTDDVILCDVNMSRSYCTKLAIYGCLGKLVHRSITWCTVDQSQVKKLNFKYKWHIFCWIRWLACDHRVSNIESFSLMMGKESIVCHFQG